DQSERIDVAPVVRDRRALLEGHAFERARSCGRAAEVGEGGLAMGRAVEARRRDGRLAGAVGLALGVVHAADVGAGARRDDPRRRYERARACVHAARTASAARTPLSMQSGMPTPPSALPARARPDQLAASAAIRSTRAR